MYGFNNTYGLAVCKEIAEKYNLKTYLELKVIASQLVFGGGYDFYERKDGYEALCNGYGLSFKGAKGMDIELKYQAINQKEIDIMVVFTIDGQLSVSDITVLKDDKNFFLLYLCGDVIRLKVLNKHPELKDIFENLTNIITDKNMEK